MKIFSIILFSILIFVGKFSMASFIFNPEAVNRFKHKINYTAIIANLPKDGLGVYMDWEDTLSHLFMDESWEVEDINTFMSATFHTETSLSLEKDDARINLKVHLFSDFSDTDVLDEALVIMSRTNMMDIIMEYDKNGPCDVFFYYSSHDEGNILSDAICVFRNVIVEVVSYSKGVDVRHVLELLHNSMKTSLVNITDFKPVITSCTVSSEVVSIGEEFYIDVTPKNENYMVELHHSYGDSLKYLDEKNLRFTLKAKQQGVHLLSISVLDSKTLLSANIQKSITVK